MIHTKIYPLLLVANGGTTRETTGACDVSRQKKHMLHGACSVYLFDNYYQTKVTLILPPVSTDASGHAQGSISGQVPIVSIHLKMPEIVDQCI